LLLDASLACHARAGGQLPLRNRIEQLIRPPQEGTALIAQLAAQTGRFSGDKRALAMLACNPFA